MGDDHDFSDIGRGRTVVQFHGAFSPCINVDFIQSFVLLTLLQARNAECALVSKSPLAGGGNAPCGPMSLT